jgi:gluconokinase
MRMEGSTMTTRGKDIPARMVVMGVAGSGKSTVGEALATRLNAIYLDGDLLHSAENIEKMSRGVPLTDADRLPWLREIGHRLAGSDGRLIVGCSALKRAYRETINAAARQPVVFVYLSGSIDVIAKRMADRVGHFMPPDLLQSQFATLEEPGPDENAIRVGIDQPLDNLLEKVIELVTERE